jgi:hypothetical protein
VAVATSGRVSVLWGEAQPRPVPVSTADESRPGHVAETARSFVSHAGTPAPSLLVLHPGAPQRHSQIFRWLSPLFALAALALLAVAAATTDLSALNGWDLARVLGPAAWASLLCAVAACVAELWSPRRRIPMLATATGVLILCSTGTPSVVEPVARFSTAWLLAGFTDAMAHDGVAPAGIDARFWWPAFFAHQWAFFRDAGGATQLDSVLR